MSEVPTNEPTPTSIPTPTPEQTPTTPAVETPAVETKPEGEKPAESLLTKPVEEPFNPDNLTLPEGFEKNELFEKSLEHFKDLPHAKAQELVNLHAEAVKQIAQQQQDAWIATNDKWQEEIKADKELGGTNLPKVLQTVSKVLDNPEFADPKIREALNMTGSGNNPAIVRTLYRMALKLTEGMPTQGAEPGRDGQGRLVNQTTTVGEALYGPNGPHSGGPRIG